MSHLPNTSGKSRQGAPVLQIQIIPSNDMRLSLAVPARLTRSTGQNRFDEVPLPVSQSENHFQTGPVSTPRSYQVIVPMGEMIFIEDINGQLQETMRGVSIQDQTLRNR